MKYTQIPFVMLASAALCFTACDLSSPKNVDEIGEEAAEFVEEIGPNRESSGEVPVPTALTTPEETISIVESAGGLLKLSPSAAVESVDKWIGTLRGHPNVDDADDLVNDLVKLKELLLTTPIDGKAVAKVLEDLANETGEAAKDADSKSVATLATALDSASDMLD